MKVILNLCLVVLCVQSLHIELQQKEDRKGLSAVRILEEVDRETVIQNRNYLKGDVTLGGGYKIDFTPDFSTSFSWVPFKGCTKDCWWSSTIKKDLYTCPANVCASAKERTKLTKTIPTQTNMNGGVTVKDGYMAWTNVNLKYTDVDRVKMVLGQAFTNRANLQNYMSLSFANTDDGVVSQMYSTGKSKKDQFSVYIADNQSFMTIGSHYDYLVNGAFVDYRQSEAQRNNEQWQLDMTGILYNDKITGFENQFKAANIPAYFDANIDNLVLPAALVKQYLALDKSCSENTKTKQIECTCNGDINKVKKMGIILESQNTNQWMIDHSSLVSVDKNTKKCILKIESTANSNAVLGRVFFNKHYVVFDRQHRMIRIANAQVHQIKSPQQNSASYWTTLVVGGLIGLLTIAMLMCVCFKDINESDIPSSQYVAPKQQPIEPKYQSQMVPIQQPIQQPQQQPIQQQMVSQPVYTQSYAQPVIVQQSVMQPQVVQTNVMQSSYVQPSSVIVPQNQSVLRSSQVVSPVQRYQASQFQS